MTHDKGYSPSGSEILLTVNSVVETLEWSTVADYENDIMLDSLDCEWSPEALATIRDYVESFIADNNDDLHGMDYGTIGHDLALTANRHGAGFWDRGLGELGERLTKSAYSYSMDAYLGDDGKVYL